MSSKPLHTFLVTNLQSCRKYGTSVKEKGLKVSTETLTGEAITFFHTDCDEGRECLRITNQGKKVCDYLIYYSKYNQNEIVCLLELKGTNLEDAAKQVTETHSHLKILINAEFRSDEPQDLKLTWRICICLHNHAPSINQRIRDRLKQDYGPKNVEIKHGISQHNIGPLLRREPE